LTGGAVSCGQLGWSEGSAAGGAALSCVDLAAAGAIRGCSNSASCAFNSCTVSSSYCSFSFNCCISELAFSGSWACELARSHDKSDSNEAFPHNASIRF
jgi:hypothetical protein